MATNSVTSSAVIAAPPATVFAILADPRQHQRIDGSGALQGSVTGPDSLVLGSEFGMGMKQGTSYRTKNKVVEFEPDRLIAWRHFGLHRWRYELDSVVSDGAAGTKVTETWDLSAYPAPVRAVFRALFAKATQRAVDETLVKLKASAESDAAAGSGKA